MEDKHMRAAIFGVGTLFFQKRKWILQQYDIALLIDNDRNKQGLSINGQIIEGCDALLGAALDAVIVTPERNDEIINQLLEMGIPKEKIYILLGNLPTNFYDVFKCYKSLSTKLEKYAISSSQILVDYYEMLQLLPVTNPLSIINVQGGTWKVCYGDINILLASWGDVETFTEIFIYKDYNLSICQKSILLDIGMNIGLATLFFVQNPNIEKIYGFEPFPEIYKLAVNNFRANEKYKDKIIAYPYGLSNENANRYVHLFESNRGQSVLFQDLENGISIQLKKAGSELQRIASENPGRNLILKLDCEGSEYQIIADIDQQNIWPSIDAIIMEWHTYKDAGITYQEVINLVALLENKKYHCIQGFKNGTKLQGSGYIYALKMYKKEPSI